MKSATGFEGANPAIIEAWRAKHRTPPSGGICDGPDWLTARAIAAVWERNDSTVRRRLRVMVAQHEVECGTRQMLDITGRRQTVPVYRLLQK
jgi:hypothetical protein